MSLRGVHIFFITLSVLLCFGFAYFEWTAFQRGRSVADGAVAAIAAAVGAGLLVYGVWFVKKSSRRSIV